MLKPILLATIYILLLTFCFGFSQSANSNIKSAIHGIIYNEQGKIVDDAHISLQPPLRNDVSDQYGKFEIGPIEEGTYTVRVEHIAYQTIEIDNISVAYGTITVLDTIFLSTGFYESESVVITATRSQKKREDIIPVVSLVDRQQIIRRNSKTSAEALREESGVFIQKTNHGGGSAIIRGLSSNQILILVDGIRLNNSTYRLGNHQYLTTVDYNMLEQIEVVHGPLSVLHGSDALGGTINLLTEKPLFVNSGNQFHYNLNSRYSSADDEKTIHAKTKFISNKIIVQTGFSYKNFGDLRQGEFNAPKELLADNSNVTQKPTGFSAFDFSSKLLYTPTAKQNVILAYQLSRQEDVPRFDKYAYNDYHKWLYTPQKRDLFYAVYENKNRMGFINSFRTTLSYHRQQEGRETQRFIDSTLTKELDDVATLGLTFQANSAIKNHLLSYGLDFYSDKINSSAKSIRFTGKNSNRVKSRFPDDSHYNSFGIFLEDEYQFNENWQANGGIRYSSFQTEFKFEDDNGIIDFNKQYNALTGSFGLMFKPNLWSSLSSNIAQGFRAPNLSDLAKFGSSKGKVFEIPNLNVNPEKALSFDLNYRVNLSSLNIETAVYYMQISDLLISSDDKYNGTPIHISDGDTLTVKSKQNGGEAFITGFESNIKYTLSKSLQLRANIAYTFGENKIADEPVGGIPPLFGLAGISWQGTNLFLETYLRFASSQNRLSADDFDDPRIPASGTPEWQTINLRGEYQINPWLKVNAAIENLLDQLYREHGSGINAPGRNFILGLSLNK